MLLRILFYSLFCINSARLYGASQAPQPCKKKIFSALAATCAASPVRSPITFEPTQRRLYFPLSAGIACIDLPTEKSDKSEPYELISIEAPEEPISALAVDIEAEKIIIGCGGRLGEVSLQCLSFHQELTAEPEPEWHMPLDSITYYKNLASIGLPMAAIRTICLVKDRQIAFSASAHKICQWSTKTGSQLGSNDHSSPVITMALNDATETLYALHASGDLQSIRLGMNGALDKATFGGKTMRVATFDNLANTLYSISADGRLYALHTRALQITHELKLSDRQKGLPIAIASKNHGVFIGDDQGSIRFYDTRTSGSFRVGVITDTEASQQLWYDQQFHTLISASSNGIRRYWME
jgi:hypothetical protein